MPLNVNTTLIDGISISLTSNEAPPSQKPTTLTLYLSPGGANTPLGSLIYALPNTTSTPLFLDEPSVDLATRIARALASRFARPVLVGSSVSSNFDTTGSFISRVIFYIQQQQQ